MILIPEICGLCGGAHKALEFIGVKINEEKSKRNPKDIFLYKQFLHNDTVIKNFSEKGVVCVDSLEEIKDGSVVIIRTHGEGSAVFDYLDGRKIEYWDATCPKVTAVHKLLREKHSMGYKIIIIGKKNHPEVIGSNGWCGDEAVIIESVREAEETEFDTRAKYYAVAQTTFKESAFEAICEITGTKINSDKLEVKNTICRVQKSIQDSSENVAKNSELMFVMGGENSSNSRELFEVCQKHCKCFYIASPEKVFEVISDNGLIIRGKTKIGITGGASTPLTDIAKLKQILAFIAFYSDTKEAVEKEISVFNGRLADEFKFDKITAEAVGQLIRVNQGGKLLRGMLTVLGYKLLANQNKSPNRGLEYSYPLAVAFEMFQTSILIHDDIIDKSDLRRGRNTVHYDYFSRHKYLINGTAAGESLDNISHVSQAVAICLGDLGFFLSNRLISENYSTDVNFVRVLAYFNKVVINTIRGEIIDVILPFEQKNGIASKNGEPKFDLEEAVMQIYTLKTAWYSIIGPIALGMILAGANDGQIAAVEEFGRDLGTAFQIKDDIIGIFGNQDETGKPSDSDIEEFKQTVLFAYVMKYASGKSDELLTLYRQCGEKSTLGEVRRIYTETGALSYAERLIADLTAKGRAAVDKAGFVSGGDREILNGFVDYLVYRTK